MSNLYEKERYQPTLAHCHALTLHFDGTKVTLSGVGPMRTYPAVSGRSSSDGRFDYSTARQRQLSNGPIPAGTYWVHPDELWGNAWYKPGSRAAWGDFRMAIHPFPTTQTYGRGGFFIHGGLIPGSAGCIDLTTRMNNFVKDLKGALGGKSKCQIHLKVEYPGKQ